MSLNKITSSKQVWHYYYINSPVDFFFWQVVHIFHLLHYHHFLLPIPHPGIQEAERLRQMRPPHRHFQHLYELCNLDLLRSHLLFWQLSLLPLWHKKIKHVKNGAIQNHLASISIEGESIQKIVSSLPYLITEDIPKHKYHLCTSQKVTELQTFQATHANMHTCDPDTYWQLKTT